MFLPLAVPCLQNGSRGVVTAFLPKQTFLQQLTAEASGMGGGGGGPLKGAPFMWVVWVGQQFQATEYGEGLCNNCEC